MKAMTAAKIAEVTNGRVIAGDPESLVWDTCTDSRQAAPGKLFVPVIGANVDGHTFIPKAAELGGAAAFTSEGIPGETWEHRMALIAVPNAVHALQALGAYYRSLYPKLPVIGITGSVGKTTTKEMIAAALSVRYNVLKTAGNMNSQVGLPQMMLRIEDSHEIAVIEMGMSEEGEMARLAPISRPQTVVMTNIGVSHIGQLGSKENIRKEKLNIINAFEEGGVLYVNGDDVLLNQIASEPEAVSMADGTRAKLALARVERYGTKADDEITADEMASDEMACSGRTSAEGKGCRAPLHLATDIRMEESRSIFTYHTKDGGEEEIVLSVPGIHNVHNALAALAIAEQFGIPACESKKGLAAYQPAPMRGRIEEHGGITLIDDTYNASPDSMKGSVEVLAGIAGAKRRIAVFADMLELGALSRDCHYEIGEYIAKKTAGAPDLVVVIGTEAAHIVSGIKENGGKQLTEQFHTNAEAALYLKKILKTGDAVIIKGSRSMKTEEIANALREAFS